MSDKDWTDLGNDIRDMVDGALIQAGFSIRSYLYYTYS